MPLIVSFRGDGPLRSTRASQRRTWVSNNTRSAFRPHSTRPTAAAGTASRTMASSTTYHTNNQPPTKHNRKSDAYLCDFYDNIWATPEQEESLVLTHVATATGVRKARRRRTAAEHQRLIDIAQVAHVLTTVLDIRSEYPQYAAANDINVWASTPTSSRGHSFSYSEGQRMSDEEDEDAERSRRLVSPIQSQRRVLVPQSAPHFRTSMIAEDTYNSDSDSARDSDHHHRPHQPEEEDHAHHDQDQDQENDSEKQRVRDQLRRHPSSAAMLVTSASLKDESDKSAAYPFGSMLPPPPLSIDTAIPPPNTQNGSTIFSRVFRQRHDWSWSSRFLLGIHEPIRHALFVMDRFIEQTHRQQQVDVLAHHVSEFFTWFKTYFIEYVTSQFDAKDKVLLPLLKLRASTETEIRHSYREIHELMQQMRQQERGLVRGAGGGKAAKSSAVLQDRASWLVRLDTLQKSIRRLNMNLAAVLNLEEKTLHEAMARAFSEKTFKSTVMPRLFRAIKSKKVVVPWIVERSKVWGGEAEQQSFQGMLPMTSRFMYKRIWRPYFMSNVAVAMNNLNEFDVASAYPHEEQRPFACVMQ